MILANSSLPRYLLNESLIDFLRLKLGDKVRESWEKILLLLGKCLIVCM